mmetsp:Transcript_25301/g.40515  ORF Transcript_25301/g.40515 Transcript_25301/m.40515 type:complete len:471 (-) Transcript_25301:182-1594(-)
MDYFAIGGKPFLSRFPPHIPGIFNPNRLQEHQQQDGGAEALLAAGVAGAGAGAEAGAAAGAAGGDGRLNPGLVQNQSEAFQALQAFQYSAQAQAFQFSAPSFQPRARVAEHGGASAGAAGVSPLSPFAPAFPDAAPPDDGFVRAPQALHQGFNAPDEVQPWEASRFEVLRKLQDATRNRGQVHLMRDTHQGNRLVAVKQMPNRWIQTCHSEFVVEHPTETEMPWQDCGCIRFLNKQSYLYGCELLGVYRDDTHTFVITAFATEGDLFSWCEGGEAPGHAREVVVQPIARQIIEGVQQLHDFNIVHRDLSLENVLMTKMEDDSLQIRLIDFSMASTARVFRNCVRGKASYQAPELHGDQEYDALLSDAFSVGVTLYAVLLKDYPWLSTRPGGCKCFEYVRKHGFRSYLAKRKLRNSTQKVVEVMSEPLVQLLEGLLAFDPAQRLTLGERTWNGQRRSVWDEAWLHTGPGTD